MLKQTADRKLKQLTHALVIAARRGDPKRCSILLAEGAQIDRPDKDRRTALIAAIEKGHVDVVKQLLNRGADPNWVIPSNDPLLPGHSGLTLAVRFGHSAIVKELLRWKADASFEKTSGGTPLSYAASCGHVDILKQLLKAGARLTDHVMDGAVRQGHEKAVEILLKVGANPNRPNIIKETLLSTASGNGHLGLVKLLIKYGAATERAQRGLTPLMWAVIRRHDEVAKWLIKHSVELETKDNGGRTALHHAVANHRLDIVKQLVASGAKVGAKNSKGITPLEIALELKNRKLVDLLR